MLFLTTASTLYSTLAVGVNYSSWQSSYGTIGRTICLLVKSRIRLNSADHNWDLDVISETNEFLKSMRNRGVHLLIVYSDGEVGDQYFSLAVAEYRLMKELGLLQTELLKGADHSITPLSCQDQLIRMIAEWLGKSD